MAKRADDVRTELPPLTDVGNIGSDDDEDDPVQAVLRLYGVEKVEELPPGVLEGALPASLPKAASVGRVPLQMVGTRRASGEGQRMDEQASTILGDCVAGLRGIAG